MDTHGTLSVIGFGGTPRLLAEAVDATSDSFKGLAGFGVDVEVWVVVITDEYVERGDYAQEGVSETTPKYVTFR